VRNLRATKKQQNVRSKSKSKYLKRERKKNKSLEVLKLFYKGSNSTSKTFENNNVPKALNHSKASESEKNVITTVANPFLDRESTWNHAICIS